MKFRILLYVMLSALMISAQNDSTSTFKDKWNKFKVKAEEKYDELKTSLEESSSSNNNNNNNNNNNSSREKSSDNKKKNWDKVASIPFDQHIVAKNFKDGSHTVFGLVDDQWERYDFEIKSVQELTDNGELNKLTIGGYEYEREREFDGFDFANINANFYCKDKNKYGIYLGGAFILYKYSYTGDEYVVSDMTTLEKPDIKIKDLKQMLLKHKQAIKDFIDDQPLHKYDKVNTGREYNSINVQKDDKVGVMTKQGGLVVPIEYDRIEDFSQGFSWVKKDDKWMIMDSTFKVWEENKYDNVGSFIQGSCFIKQGKKIGTLDKKLKENWIFTKGEYTYIRCMGDYYKVINNERYGIISKDKKTVLECKYLHLNTELTNDNNIVITQGEDGLKGFYKIGHGWITERIYDKAGVSEEYHYENGKKIYSDYMFVEIINHGRSKSLDDYSTTGKVSIDGTINWEDRAVTAPNKYPNKELLPFREKYIVRSQRILDGNPIIVKNEDTQKEGLIEADGTIIIDLKYEDITDQHPDYILLEKFEAHGSLGGDQTIITYNVYTGLSGPTKIATEKTALGGAVAYTDSFSNFNSSSSSSHSSSNSNSSSTTSNSSTSENSGPQYKGTITVKNDTGGKLFVWLGSGSGYVNKGNTKLANCAKGVKVYAGSSSSSSSKKFLFEVTPEMCGKTIKLSKYL